MIAKTIQNTLSLLIHKSSWVLSYGSPTIWFETEGPRTDDVTLCARRSRSRRISYERMRIDWRLTSVIGIVSENNFNRLGSTLKTRPCDLPFTMSSNLFGLFDWEGEDQSSVLSLGSIVSPRREFHDYANGETVQAKFGKRTYKAVLSKISGENETNAFTCIQIFFVCLALFFVSLVTSL